MKRTRTTQTGLAATALRSVLLSSVCCSLAAPGFAQDAASQEESAEDRIIITGTQIKGAKIDDVLPVTKVDTIDIETSGVVSGDELFRSIPQSGAVNFQDNKTSGGINDARGDVASINLRELGTGNTLLLVNGRRMVLNPGFQTELLVPVVSPNTNTIPASGVRRVEVLRDGASAIYGADAVGGVVNTILKSNRTDGFVTAQYGMAEETSQHELNLSAGYGFDFNGGRSNLTMYADFFDTNTVLSSERDFSASDDKRPFLVGTRFEDDANFDARSIGAPWGRFRASRRISAIADDDFHIQPETLPGCRLTLGNGICLDDGSTTIDRDIRYDVSPDRDLFSARTRLNLNGLFTHEIDADHELYAEAHYYAFDSLRERESGQILSGQEIGITENAYYNPFGATLRRDGSPNTSRLPALAGVPAGGLSLQMIAYRVADSGPRRVDVTGDTYRLLGGLRGAWGDWDYDTAVLYSKAKVDDIQRNSTSLTALQNSINLSTPDAYNPFNGTGLQNLNSGDGTPSSPAAIEAIQVDVFRKGETDLFLADFKLSRDDLFVLPGGNLGVATGVEFRQESFIDDRDPRLDGTITFTNAITGEVYGGDLLSNSPTPDSSGERDVISAYFETFVPIISDEMDIPLVQNLDVQLAGRYESFSDSGETFVPRVAASWGVTDGLLFRAAWSEGFRVPNLVQVNDDGVQRSNVRDDYVRCQAQVEKGLLSSLGACAGQRTTDVRSGSENLKPEDTESINLGVVFSPQFLPGLTFTADYWEIEQRGIVGLFGTQNHIALDLLLRQEGSFNPAVIRVAPDQDTIDLFTGTSLSPAGEIDFVSDTYVNLDQRKTEGVDLGVYYDLNDTAWGDFRFRFNAARLNTFFQSPGGLGQTLLDAVESGALPNEVEISGLGELLEEDGRPKWQFSAGLNWSAGNWDAGLFGRYVGRFYDPSAIQDDDGSLWEVKPWFVANASLSYTFDGDHALEDTRLRLRVNNLLNEDPPLADETLGFYGEYHNAKGRFYSLEIHKDF